MKKLLLLSLTYVALWAVWYFAYPYFLIWLEGFSFFTTLPDFTAIHFHLPEDTFRYVGSEKLKNRVNQYFRGAHDYKTTKLVSNIVDFDYVDEKDVLHYIEYKSLYFNRRKCFFP